MNWLPGGLTLPNRPDEPNDMLIDMLAGSADPGEGLTTSGKPGPDNIMAVTSDPFPGPNADRWCRHIGPTKTHPRSRAEPAPDGDDGDRIAPRQLI